MELITAPDSSDIPAAVHMEIHASAASNDGPAIGRRVKVYWDGEGRHFHGTVTERDQHGWVKVCYDDGDEHWEDGWSKMAFVKSCASSTSTSTTVSSNTTANSSSGQTVIEHVTGNSRSVLFQS